MEIKKTLDTPVNSYGVLAIQQLQQAVNSGVVVVPEEEPIPVGSYQPASIDLRLGNVAYRLRSSFLPGPANEVVTKLHDHVIDVVPLDGKQGAVLETNRPYLIPLIEGLRLPEGVKARANPKSSTGRLDIFTRIITDFSSRFDEIRPGYTGPLFVEVISRSFTVRLRKGLTLNQVRLIVEDPKVRGLELSGETSVRASELHSSVNTAVIFDNNLPLSVQQIENLGGAFLRVDLAGSSAETGGEPDEVVGYRARRGSGLVDLTDPERNDPSDFWEPLWRDKGRLILEPEEFYLLRSQEHVRIPASVAGELVAYDPASGELRTHYAGFFDPGFGEFEEEHPPGSCAVLEVRAHDVPFLIENGQQVGKLTFEPMIEHPVQLYGSGEMNSNYQGQPRMLSKYFRTFRGRQMPLLFH
jgi:dCTP deaminase